MELYRGCRSECIEVDMLKNIIAFKKTIVTRLKKEKLGIYALDNDFATGPRHPSRTRESNPTAGNSTVITQTTRENFIKTANQEYCTPPTKN